jgi:hypothetical protein
MSSPRFNSVEEYLASLDTKERTLRSVIDLIGNLAFKDNRDPALKWRRAG